MPAPASEFDDFPPHLQLLLLAAQPRLKAGPQRRLEELTTGSCSATMDWHAFVTLTVHHRLAPVVFNAVGETLPAQAREPLQWAATRNAFSALRAAGEFRRISEAFAKRSIPLIALKGIVLSQLLYGSPNARHVGDLDLLTTVDTLPEQVELLRGVGYHVIQPEAPLTPRRLQSYTRYWKDFTFENTQAGFELDLHWRLFNNPVHPANRLRDAPELMAVSVFETSLNTLSLRNQFLYTAAHGAGEAFTYLKALSDVAAFLHLLTPVQLEEALAHASSIGLLPQVSAAIHLANAWMLTGVESPRLLPASHPVAVALRGRTWRLLKAQNLLPTRSYPSPASWIHHELQLTPGLRSLSEAAGRFLFRPRVWSAVNLPDSLFPLYPVLGLLLPPRRHKGQSQAAPRTPLESPNLAGTTGVSKSPPNT